MTTKEKIAIMQAYKDGKKIQARVIDYESWWGDISNPSWNWAEFDYRIKPEEEPKRMTNRQLLEWLARGFGERTHKKGRTALIDFIYYKDEENCPIDNNTLIRPWDSDDWVEPTVDIYERDCKESYEERGSESNNH